MATFLCTWNTLSVCWLMSWSTTIEFGVCCVLVVECCCGNFLIDVLPVVQHTKYSHRPTDRPSVARRKGEEKWGDNTQVRSCASSSLSHSSISIRSLDTGSGSGCWFYRSSVLPLWRHQDSRHASVPFPRKLEKESWRKTSRRARADREQVRDDGPQVLPIPASINSFNVLLSNS